VLLCGAGLFVRSLSNVENVRLGYDVDPVLYVSRGGAFGAGRGSGAGATGAGNPLTGFAGLGNAFRGAYSSEHEFRDVRFRLTLQPDGTLTGAMANYRPIDNIYLSQYGGGRGTASTANQDCAAEYNMMAKMADGYPDPATGQCTMISAAQNIAGVPAFVVAPPGETLSAIRTGSTTAAR